MASNTPKLALLKKDPILDGNDTFNIQTMLNENWDKIDEKVAVLDPETGKIPANQVEIDSTYLNNTGYAVATGTANTFLANLTPALSTYTEGFSIRVKINVTNTGASTLNVNGLGARAIKKSNGSDLASGNLKAGSIYTFTYDGTAFILQGEGGEYGTAIASDVLAGKTIGTENGLITGNIPSKAAATITPGTTNQTIASGQYLSGVQTILGDPDLIAQNIIGGKNIFGVDGGIPNLGGTNQPSLGPWIGGTDLYLPVKNQGYYSGNGGSGIYHNKDAVMTALGGKRVAEGVVPLTGTLGFTDYNDVTTYSGYINVNTLGFRPKWVAIYEVANGQFVTVYNESLAFRGQSGVPILCGNTGFKLGGNAIISDVGFQLPVAYQGGNHRYFAGGY